LRGNIERLSYTVKKDFLDLTGRNILLAELRLLPYIDYCCKNACFVAERVNVEERKLLSRWQRLGLIKYSSAPGHSHMSVSERFYHVMSRVLFDTYVDTLED
jgi:hypothetical protein